MSVTFKTEEQIIKSHGDIDIESIILKGQLAILNAWKENSLNKKDVEKKSRTISNEEKMKIAVDLYHIAMEPSIGAYNKAQQKLDLINEKYGLEKQSLREFFEENNINNITMNEEEPESKLVA